MNDITELFLGALAIVLGGAAFAVGGQVIHDAWRGAFQRPPVTMGRERADEGHLEPRLHHLVEPGAWKPKQRQVQADDAPG